jgi:hypothetical protein
VVKEFYQAASETTREDILNPVCYPEEAIFISPLNLGSGVTVAEARCWTRNSNPESRSWIWGAAPAWSASSPPAWWGRKAGNRSGYADAMLTLAEQGSQGVAINLDTGILNSRRFLKNCLSRKNPLTWSYRTA